MMANATSKLGMWMKNNFQAWKASTFITGLVISNSLAEFIIVGNLVNFIYSDFASAAVIVSVKEGMTCFMAILGASIADAYISRYFVVLASTALFIYGLLVLSVSELKVASRVALPCIAAALIAAGEGGQQHTLRKLGADQFTEHMKQLDKKKAILHSRVWWHMSAFVGATAGLLLAFLLNRSEDAITLEKIYFLSPPITMLVAFYVAAFGALFCYRATPVGSPLARMWRVLMASACKYHLDYPADESKVHGRVNRNCISMAAVRSSLKENQQFSPAPIVGQRDDDNIEKGAPSSPKFDCEASVHPSPPPDVLSAPKPTRCLLHPSFTGYEASVHPSPLLDSNATANNDVEKEWFWLPHTNRLRWLDKAAIMEEPAAEGTQVSKWRLCTQTEVEESKYLLRLFPIWVTFLMYGMVLSIGKTFFIAQANTLDRGVRGKISHNHFQIPITFLLAVSGLSKLLVTQACLPLLKRSFTDLGRSSEAYPRIRIAVGFFVSALCCLVASFVETKRLHVAKKTGRPAWFHVIDQMSIFWLIPQFCLLGAMDGLVEEGMADLFVDQVPTEQLRRCKAAFCDSVKGMGSMLGALMILLIKTVRPGWFGDAVDSNRVHLYYLAFSVLSLINLLVYGFVARTYPCKGGHDRNPLPCDQGGKASQKKWAACMEALSDQLVCG